MVERRLEQAAEESRKGGQGVKGWQSLPDGALGNPFGYHSRGRGNDNPIKSLNQAKASICPNIMPLPSWIPAFAGMTTKRKQAGLPSR